MAAPIEDYALIGDTHTAGLVSREGSIDWLCLPRFDSPACFAALLGDRSNGRWLLAPAGPVREVRRRYQGDTLVLETEYRTDDGVVRVVDCMPPRQSDPDLARVVEGVRGRVPMRMELTIRFDYGSIVPWVRHVDGALHAVAGPDSVWLRTPVPVRGENWTTLADFTVAEGERAPFMLTWHASHRPAPRRIDPVRALGDTEAWWGEWASGIDYGGGWQDAVIRSLLTLKALTYAPTGGIVAAPTTSLPEQLGGVRNWDYRYCWLRDATFTLSALMLAGLADEAGPGASGCCGPSPASRGRCRSCTAWPASAASPSRSWTGWPATRGRGRCGSATRPSTSSSSTSTARSWTPCTWAATGLETRRGGLATSSRRCSSSWSRTGASRTRASGRSAAHGGTSPTPR